LTVSPLRSNLGGFRRSRTLKVPGCRTCTSRSVSVTTTASSTSSLLPITLAEVMSLLLTIRAWAVLRSVSLVELARSAPTR